MWSRGALLASSNVHYTISFTSKIRQRNASQFFLMLKVVEAVDAIKMLLCGRHELHSSSSKNYLTYTVNSFHLFDCLTSNSCLPVGLFKVFLSANKRWTPARQDSFRSEHRFYHVAANIVLLIAPLVSAISNNLDSIKHYKMLSFMQVFKNS